MVKRIRNKTRLQSRRAAQIAEVNRAPSTATQQHTAEKSRDVDILSTCVDTAADSSREIQMEEILLAVASHLDATEQYASDTFAYPEPEQQLLCILGGPGSGKTTLFNALAALFEIREDKYHRYKHQCASFTGKAAILLKDGWTLSSFLKLCANESSAANSPFPDCSKPADIVELKENCKDLTRILVDEVSMVYSVMLGQTDVRLRQALDCPGKPIALNTDAAL